MKLAPKLDCRGDDRFHHPIHYSSVKESYFMQTDYQTSNKKAVRWLSVG